MCGIAGIVSLDGFDPKCLISMTQMIEYRGPDAYGFAFGPRGSNATLDVQHCDPREPKMKSARVGLGNRRLSILDLSASGHQPMRTEDGALCITFNGEIYNYLEIRELLLSLGHRFFSNTDTEVILRSYAEWGEDCVQRFNGMWSFALWDSRKRTLFCSRDRFGVKPFYFSVSDRNFYFGSEIKQILSGSGIKREANERAVADFLEFGLQDHLEQTAFENVFQLMGGHSFTVELKEPLRPRITRYWDLKAEPELDMKPAEAEEEFHSYFERAVRLRLRSDVPVGISLSGGLDSSSVLCEARRIAPELSFKCFSACFEKSNIDERSYIAAVTAATNSSPFWTFPDGHAFWDGVRTIAYHQDEPIGGPSVFAQWNVMQEARRNNVHVLLGGQGGDESLCGYRKYYFFYVWHLLRRGDPAVLREAAALATTFGPLGPSLSKANRYLPSVARIRTSAAGRIGSAKLVKAARECETRLGAGSSLAQRQKTDLLKSSIPKLLRHEDRNSMAHSVETRLPFLDYQLVEFAIRCPSSLKLRNGWTKWILREALDGTLPDMVRLRKSKLGFDVPEGDWLRLGLKNGQRKLWESSELRMGEYLATDRLSRECDSFLRGESTALPPAVLFRAISLELWAQVHGIN
jgi:asparagine synthase (glutamine-hydrolysing)